MLNGITFLNNSYNTKVQCLSEVSYNNIQICYRKKYAPIYCIHHIIQYYDYLQQFFRNYFGFFTRSCESIVNIQQQFFQFNHSHKKRKDESNWPFYILMLRTKLYQNFIILYRASKCMQNKEQGSEDCLWTYIIPFSKIIVSFFLRFLSRSKQNRIKLCYNRLHKKHKLALYKAQIGQPNYVNHKFFFDVLLRTTCAKTWGQTSIYYIAGQLVGACIV